MYKCKNCGHIFEEGEQATWTEKHGFSSGPYEEWSGCPICQGSFEEAKKCEYCSNYFIEGESRSNVICEDCVDEIETRFSNLLHNNFTEFERTVLNDIFDGKELK